MLLECINTSVWNLFIIPEEDWSQSKSIEEYEVNKLKNEDGYSCFYAFVQLPGHSSKTVLTKYIQHNPSDAALVHNKLSYSSKKIAARPCCTLMLTFWQPLPE